MYVFFVSYFKSFLDRGRTVTKFFFKYQFQGHKEEILSKSEATANIASLVRRMWLTDESATPNRTGSGIFQKGVLDLISKELPGMTELRRPASPNLHDAVK